MFSNFHFSILSTHECYVCYCFHDIFIYVRNYGVHRSSTNSNFHLILKGIFNLPFTTSKQGFRGSPFIHLLLFVLVIIYVYNVHTNIALQNIAIYNMNFPLCHLVFLQILHVLKCAASNFTFLHLIYCGDFLSIQVDSMTWKRFMWLFVCLWLFFDKKIYLSHERYV